MVVRSSSPPTLHASSPYCPAAPRREASLRFDQISKPSMTGPHTSASSTLLGSSMETEMYPLTHNHAFGNMPHMPHHVESSRNPAFDGPNRFGPVCRSGSVQEDLLKCHVSSMGNFTRLQQTCQNNGIHRHFTQEQIFQVAAYKNFSVGKAFRLLKKMDPRYMNTTIQQIESQLNTHTLFPLPPDLRAPAVDAFFYMRPARYHPLETPTSTIIANLIYVMNSIYQRHRDYENHKIGFIANMNDWTMEHFSVDYCFQFMQGLQGRLAPVNVDMFLIVNPPAWFGRVWKIMKPMLSPAFRKKVYMISEEKLSKYLSPGFEAHLPNEFKCGQADVPSMVHDYIAFRKYVEGENSMPEQPLGQLAQKQQQPQPVWSPTHVEGSKKHRRWMRRMTLSRTVSHRERVRSTPIAATAAAVGAAPGVDGRRPIHSNSVKAPNVLSSWEAARRPSHSSSSGDSVSAPNKSRSPSIGETYLPTWEEPPHPLQAHSSGSCVSAPSNGGSRRLRSNSLTGVNYTTPSWEAERGDHGSAPSNGGRRRLRSNSLTPVTYTTPSWEAELATGVSAPSGRSRLRSTSLTGTTTYTPSWEVSDHHPYHHPSYMLYSGDDVSSSPTSNGSRRLRSNSLTGSTTYYVPSWDMSIRRPSCVSSAADCSVSIAASSEYGDDISIRLLD